MTKNHSTQAGRDKPKESLDKSAKPNEDTAPDEQKSEKQHLDERLEEALEETFPASDPIALTPPGKNDRSAKKGRPPRHTKYGREGTAARKR